MFLTLAFCSNRVFIPSHAIALSDTSLITQNKIQAFTDTLMNPAKTRKSKIINQYTKIFDLSTCTLTPQRFREACFLTKRRQVVQNHPTLEGCLLFIKKKKQLLNARHPLKCWVMRLLKSQDHHLTHWVLFTFSEGGRGWIRNQTYHPDYHEPTESTSVREHRKDTSEKATFDLTAGQTLGRVTSPFHRSS